MQPATEPPARAREREREREKASASEGRIRVGDSFEQSSKIVQNCSSPQMYLRVSGFPRLIAPDRSIQTPPTPTPAAAAPPRSRAPV